MPKRFWTVLKPVWVWVNNILVGIIVGVVVGLAIPWIISLLSRRDAISILSGPGCNTNSGERGELFGAVSRVDFFRDEDDRVVVYVGSHKAGKLTWEIRPSTAQPFTTIQGDGSWLASTERGIYYAAMLVRPTFEPMSVTDGLPAGRDILTLTVVQACPKLTVGAVGSVR
jgi:hypothetical protein